METTSAMDEAGAPLLESEEIVNGVVDFKGRRSRRSTSGGWKSASFIIGVEIAERSAYYGISSNLITFLTGPLRQSVAAAAANVNVWSGVASLTPLLGAFVCDSFLGRYATIIISSLLYVMALGALTLLAALPSIYVGCQGHGNALCSSSQPQVIFFFLSLYLVAIAQGGHKPCVQAFGADQFDSHDPNESKAKSSFFNWWYFCLCGSSSVAVLILSYVQDDIGWGLGFGIPCIVMAVSLVVFLLGTMTYRFSIKDEARRPFVRISQVFIAAAKNWQTNPYDLEEKERATLVHQGFNQFKFLNKALLAPDGSTEDATVCSMSAVEEAKAVLRLVPVWFTCLGYAIVFAQPSTLFTKQGVNMDRSIGPNFKIPSASLQSFVGVSVVMFVPIYDRMLVPIARAISRKPSGITMLQRIGTGLFLSFISMVVAALVEKERLRIALEHGLIDKPTETVPMKVWWLVPQYLLFGLSDVFTMVGLQEFFYDQVPSELRSIGLALYLSIFGVGNFLSGFLVSVIDGATKADGSDGWFSDNLNRAHLDYFYWLLAGIAAVALLLYLYFAKSYIYNRRSVAN